MICGRDWLLARYSVARSQENAEVVRRYLGRRINALNVQVLDPVMQSFMARVGLGEDPKVPEPSVNAETPRTQLG